MSAKQIDKMIVEASEKNYVGFSEFVGQLVESKMTTSITSKQDEIAKHLFSEKKKEEEFDEEDEDGEVEECNSKKKKVNEASLYEKSVAEDFAKKLEKALNKKNLEGGVWEEELDEVELGDGEVAYAWSVMDEGVDGYIIIDVPKKKLVKIEVDGYNVPTKTRNLVKPGPLNDALIKSIVAYIEAVWSNVVDG